MKFAVVADDIQKAELTGQGTGDGAEITWLEEPGPVSDISAFVDLLFTPDKVRINKLQELQTEIIIINSVENTLAGLPERTVRINGWPGFLKRNTIEACCSSERIKSEAKKIFNAFGKSVEWVNDTPGFVSARVVAMIINEAYLALEERVSSKEEIDTAMKLGTSYPYGPFEWGSIIGLKNIYSLLNKLADTNARYSPAALLKKEALEQ